MKKIFAFILTLLMLLQLCACAASEKGVEASAPAPEKSEKTENVSESPEVSSSEMETSDTANGTVVIYFSATGTTKAVAEKIASVTGADLYEIVPVDIYTDEDLDWHDKNSRTTKEQNDPSARPEIAGEMKDISDYDTVFIGYPIWWGEEPRIMDTFAESCDLEGKTVIPFCTSGGSGIGSSGKNLEELAGKGNWLNGRRLKSNASEPDISEWLSELGLNR
ncbi:MAG: NAD(P)H-dependent oxidoreductase [Clostridia bacterium]|nr:NAD(P)H-dependent oxidoreductase [Clostridia bacterium]